ncbi:MAG: exosortase family protein XrtF [Cytophagales bacterium]|nr:exosortase family protein XrtF [Cytophagales bacterium]
MKNSAPWKEFRPAMKFLVIFVATYLLGNVLYGLFVEYYKPEPDPMTVWVTSQAAHLLNASEAPVNSITDANEPVVWLRSGDRIVLGVFEGCNGLNVIIVFVSFLAAFGGRTKNIIVYAIFGCAILHGANLLRVILLYQAALNQPVFFYYFHKYFFTAVLYLVVFALWYQWTRMKSSTRESSEYK